MLKQEHVREVVGAPMELKPVLGSSLGDVAYYSRILDQDVELVGLGFDLADPGLDTLFKSSLGR